MEWIIVFVEGFFALFFRWILISLPGGTIRWLWTGRKRRWIEMTSEDESFDNFRAVVLLILTLAVLFGIGYWIWSKVK